MKKNIVIFLAIGILMTGCTKEPENTEAPKTTAVEVVETPDSDALKPLTVEAVEALAAKHEELVLEDFAPYMDISPIQEEGSLWETLEFSYKGKTMCLRVSASDKNLAAAPYEGYLDGAIVFQEEYLELDTLEQEYAEEGCCADIRSCNLEHILNGTVEMEDYIAVTLPEGLTQSGYKCWMGSHGGVTFLSDGQAKEEITLQNVGIYAEESQNGGIEIWGIGQLIMETVKELEPLNLEEVILQRKVLQTEQGRKWYAAYTVQEGSRISYCFYLDAEKFTEEEFLAATETIQLQEHAIY